MRVVRTIKDMQSWSRGQHRAGQAIGFVPTMGYLHEGHLSLVSLARAHAQQVVLSIFVNPTQFGPGEDLDRYPRDFARDEALCRAAGVDVVFYPDVPAMYPAGCSTYVVEEALGTGLCGAARPGHFRGVTTIVAKLLNIVLPDVCVLGEKDAQQLRVLRRMVKDLNFPVTVVPGPTMREADGLAMSSRNKFLQPAERAEAAWISRGLFSAQEACLAGEHDAERLLDIVRHALTHAPSGTPDYISLVDDETLEPVRLLEKPALLAVAIRFPSARLIDNITLVPA